MDTRTGFALSLLACLLSATTALAQGHPSLRIEHAWVRAAPPGAAALAGYAQLHNDGASVLQVGACETAGFGEASLHETRHEDGMARMRPVAQLQLQPGASVTLEPGGMHLMLMRPAAQPAPGDRVPVCLSVDGVAQQVPFDVRRTPPGPAAEPDAHQPDAHQHDAHQHDARGHDQHAHDEHAHH